MTDLEALNKKIDKALNVECSNQITKNLQSSNSGTTNCNFCAKHGMCKKYYFHQVYGNVWICNGCSKKTWKNLSSKMVVQVGKTRTGTCGHCGMGGALVYSHRWKSHHYYGTNTHNFAICDSCANISSPEKTKITIQRLLNDEMKKVTKQKKEATTLAQSYIDAGIGEPFAIAIARDEENADSVLDLWEADWWKQYDVNDDLVGAVLDGTLPESDAKWLNTIRSDHQDLVMDCIHLNVTVDWAKALMDSGFEGDSDGVSSILNGANPAIVARIRKIKPSGDFPPQLDGSMLKIKKDSQATKRKNSFSQTAEYKGFKEMMLVKRAPEVKRICQKIPLSGYSSVGVKERRQWLIKGYLKISNMFLNKESPFSLSVKQKRSLLKSIHVKSSGNEALLDMTLNNYITTLGIIR